MGTDGWWSTKQAAGFTGYSPQAIRKWANTGRVTSRRVRVGQRDLIEVSESDVRRETSLIRRAIVGMTASAPESEQLTVLRDRVATLEDVIRRYRHIEELQSEITDRQSEIARQHRDIEVVLEGPSIVPDHTVDL